MTRFSLGAHGIVLGTIAATARAVPVEQVDASLKASEEVILTNADRILLPTDRGARCLNGSPPAIYISKGSDPSRWLIFHQGGGWCSNLEDCCSKADLWFSNHRDGAAPVADLAMIGGYFRRDRAVNPLMHDWNFAYLTSCDGGSFAGARSKPLVGVCGAKGPPALHFAGSRIIDESIRYLKTEHGLGEAKEVIIGGCSAGGLAVFLHADRWAAALPSVPRVVAMADSGFFLDPMVSTGSTFNAQMQWVFNAMNATEGVDASCISYYQSPESAPHMMETWRCMFAQYVAPHVKTPLFLAQSAYDFFQTKRGSVIGTDDSTQAKNDFGDSLRDAIKSTLLSQPQHAAFIDACTRHCLPPADAGSLWHKPDPHGACLWNRMHVNGITHDAALTAFLRPHSPRGGAILADGAARDSLPRLWEQRASYPCNECCLGSPVESGMPFQASRERQSASEY